MRSEDVGNTVSRPTAESRQIEQYEVASPNNKDE